MLPDGLRPALIGLGLGLLLSILVTRVLQSMLFGTKPLDPVVFSGVIATLLALFWTASLPHGMLPGYIQCKRFDPSSTGPYVSFERSMGRNDSIGER